jgi:protein-S-isoprenylcysteine O-methyltransferase Ste14
MASDDPSLRWVELLCALRAEHLARLHAFGRLASAGVLAVSLAIFFGVLHALDALWDLSLDDSDLGLPLAVASGAALLLAGVGVALALHQQRRERGAAIGALDRAVPQLLAGADPQAVLGELSEQMKRIAPPRAPVGPAPYLPSRLDRRWLGTTAYTKVCLALALLLLASLLLAQALVASAPPPAEEELDSGTPTAAVDLLTPS